MFACKKQPDGALQPREHLLAPRFIFRQRNPLDRHARVPWAGEGTQCRERTDPRAPSVRMEWRRSEESRRLSRWSNDGSKHRPAQPLRPAPFSITSTVPTAATT